MEDGLLGKRLYFIINPSAGGGNSRVWWEQMIPQLDKTGYNYFWEYTKIGLISQQVREAVLHQGAEAVIVVGGDGSLFDVLNGIVENDVLIKPDLIIVASPMGSACDFGKMIYKGKQDGPWELLTKGEIRRIDIGRCLFRGDGTAAPNTRYFINSFDAGVGADTCVEVNAVEGRMKRFWRNGKIAFMLSSLKVLMTYKYTKARIELPEETFEGEYIIIGFGNGIYAGGGMKLFPKAKLDDGLLDLLLVPKKNRLQILQLFKRVYDGSIINIAGVIYRQVPKIAIHTKIPIYVEMDGEVPGKTDVEIDVLPRFLPVLAFPENLI